jgi:excinuclease ABC subunit B
MERMQAMRQEMFLAAENLQFEKAARLRDELRKLQADLGPGSGEVVALPPARAAGAGSRRPAGKGAAPRAAPGKKRPRRGSR